MEVFRFFKSSFGISDHILVGLDVAPNNIQQFTDFVDYTLYYIIYLICSIIIILYHHYIISCAYS